MFPANQGEEATAPGVQRQFSSQLIAHGGYHLNRVAVDSTMSSRPKNFKKRSLFGGFTPKNMKVSRDDCSE